MKILLERRAEIDVVFLEESRRTRPYVKIEETD